MTLSAIWLASLNATLDPSGTKNARPLAMAAFIFITVLLEDPFPPLSAAGYLVVFVLHAHLQSYILNHIGMFFFTFPRVHFQKAIRIVVFTLPTLAHPQHPHIHRNYFWHWLNLMTAQPDAFFSS